ncbi:MAG: pyridoxal phosphate-dependent aminotransferase [Deltaproteobacteria bacterium]|jgi:aspartate/methionine/tyrosine aminotransferase|nr:pyridoxal phosphate-dependent aminotransferase [Deltaproteobacteria bacterium]
MSLSLRDSLEPLRPLAPIELAQRANTVTPFMVMEVLEAAQRLEKAGRRIIHLEVGEPDFPTPEVIVEAMKEALSCGAFKYTHSQGDLELREALSQFYWERYQVKLEPERFIIFPGTSPGLTFLFGALLEPGQRVLFSDPYYSCYPNLVGFFGGRPLLAKVKESDGFRFNPEELRDNYDFRSVKAIMVNSPANPTGAVLDGQQLKKIAGLGPLIVSDEIYHGLNYTGQRDHTILEFTDRAVVVGGFSKAFAMTGWRVGYLIAPPEMVRPLRSISQNFFISVNAACQKAAAAALRLAWPEVEKMRAIYDSRRTLLVEGLRRLGLGVMVEPQGAFYVLARADHLNKDSKALVFQILEQAGVGLTPGAEFGRGAEGFLRFSYAASKENIEEALSRLAAFISSQS